MSSAMDLNPRTPIANLPSSSGPPPDGPPPPLPAGASLPAGPAGPSSPPAPVPDSTAIEPATAPAGALVAETNITTPIWGPPHASHPLAQLAAELPSILSEASYAEVYGVTLVDPPSFHTYLILQKFLRANANDVAKAQAQLLATLKWRKEYKPLEALEEVFEKTRFDGLGYVVVMEGKEEDGKSKEREVCCFNVYGVVKDTRRTFEDLDGFLRWRIALMELSLAQLNLSETTVPIPDYNAGPDPHQVIQVHDYLSVSFIRMDPHIRAASTATIKLFKDYYPETLSRKFFVNIPLVMGWMFAALRPFMAKETLRKFVVLSYGQALATELGGVGEMVPPSYGGNGPRLEEGGLTVKYDN